MKFILSLSASIVFSSSLFSAPNSVSITDKSGRSIEVTLVSLTGATLKCKKKGSPRVIALPLNRLDKPSVTRVKQALEKQQNEAADQPPLEAEVSISKRRKPSNGSSYMKQMEISAKVTIKNKNLNIEANCCKGRMILIGQDQSNTDQFEILQNEAFEITPSHSGQEHRTKTIRTSYDSDNKGSGNIGGSKYSGYILIVCSKDGSVLTSKTTISNIKNRLGPHLIEKISKLKTQAKVDEEFEPLL